MLCRFGCTVWMEKIKITNCLSNLLILKECQCKLLNPYSASFAINHRRTDLKGTSGSHLVQPGCPKKSAISLSFLIDIFTVDLQYSKLPNLPMQSVPNPFQ